MAWVSFEEDGEERTFSVRLNTTEIVRKMIPSQQYTQTIQLYENEQDYRMTLGEVADAAVAVTFMVVLVAKG